MEYKGYNVEEIENGVIVENIKDFNPVHIFECGQCFRWAKEQDGSFTGVAKGKVINVSVKGNKLIINNANLQDFKDTWFEYFDLGRDYSSIKDRLAEDEIMKKAIEFGHGIRILKQDFWETLISFIISANNQIPRIMKSVNLLAMAYGEELSYNGNKYYTFPGPEKLSESCVEELENCKIGFRCKYILKTSMIIKNQDITPEKLESMDTNQAREELKKLPGVGNKVADCTLLYSGIKTDVFPTDVWVKRVMEELYFGREATLAEIQEFASAKFGPLRGIAQQYLFYYARENKIGIK